jgi:hypothetical protein
VGEMQRFRYRSLVSFSTFFLFLTLALSGIAMYLRPEGSVARWTGWSLLGADKKGWEELHIVIALAFAVLALIHIVLNWKTLVAYLRSRAVRGMRLKREAAAAFLLVVLIVAAAIVACPPAAQLMKWRGSIKDGKAVLVSPPPAADADRLPLADIARITGIDLADIQQRLAARGIEVKGPEDTLEKIAKRSRSTPERVFGLLLASPSQRP